MANKSVDSVTLEAILARLEAVEKENEQLKKERGAAVKAAPASANVEIGCNLIQGINLSSPNGDVDTKIGYRDVVMLPADDVIQVLKGGDNRNLFINGLLYFTDENCYEQFGIKRRHNINRDVIKDLVLSNDTHKMGIFFDEKTRRKMDATMVHTIFYTIVDLNVEGELDGMLYETREFIEKYFSMEMKMAGKLYLDSKNFSL